MEITSQDRCTHSIPNPSSLCHCHTCTYKHNREINLKDRMRQQHEAYMSLRSKIWNMLNSCIVGLEFDHFLKPSYLAKAEAKSQPSKGMSYPKLGFYSILQLISLFQLEINRKFSLAWYAIGKTSKIFNFIMITFKQGIVAVSNYHRVKNSKTRASSL